MRVLLDQGLPLSAARTLRERDWDVTHVAEIGLSRATDSEILEYARREDFVCVRLDADFHALMAVEYASAPSVIRIRKEGVKGPELAALLQDIWPKIVEALAAGAVVTVTEQTLRLRRMPILGDG